MKDGGQKMTLASHALRKVWFDASPPRLTETKTPDPLIPSKPQKRGPKPKQHAN